MDSRPGPAVKLIKIIPAAAGAHKVNQRRPAVDSWHSINSVKTVKIRASADGNEISGTISSANKGQAIHSSGPAREIV